MKRKVRRMKKQIIGILGSCAALPFLFGFSNIAHRGSNENGQYGEHSYQAYDRAIALKANYLELDVQKTSDGVLVVSHDANMSRIFGADVLISKTRYADLLKYRNQAGEPIHTLQEVFNRYKNNSNIKFMIETKNYQSSTGMEEQLVNLINQEGLQDRVLFESFSKDSLNRLAQLAPYIPRTMLGGDYREIGDNQYFANGNYDANTASYLKQNGKKYLLWGINDKDAMKRLVDSGDVEGIITDYPGRLSEVLGVSQYAPQDINGEIVVKYVGNYSINVWNGYGSGMRFSGQRIKNGTKHSVVQVAVKDGKTWYNLGNNRWIDGNYVAYYPKSNYQAPSQKQGVIRVKYRPNYSINIWTSPTNPRWTGKRLKHGTSWRYFATVQANGRTWYNLGGSQWIDGKYVTVVK